MAVSVNEADAIEGARIISFGTSTCGDLLRNQHKANRCIYPGLPVT